METKINPIRIFKKLPVSIFARFDTVFSPGILTWERAANRYCTTTTIFCFALFVIKLAKTSVTVRSGTWSFRRIDKTHSRLGKGEGAQ